MNQVIIRDVESKDIPDIKTIVGKTWNLERLVENESTLEAALNIISNGILNKSSFGKVAVLNEQVEASYSGHRTVMSQNIVFYKKKLFWIPLPY